MLSYRDLLIIMEENAFLQNSEDETPAMQVVRTGMQLRSEGCGSFWDDFINICGNPDSVSDLLDVPKEKVTGWSSRIQELIGKIQKKDGAQSDKSTMMKTGEIELGGEPDSKAMFSSDESPAP